MLFTEFVTMVTGTVAVVTDAVGIMMEPPIVWFVALGFFGAAVSTAKVLVPRKRAK